MDNPIESPTLILPTEVSIVVKCAVDEGKTVEVSKDQKGEYHVHAKQVRRLL